MQDELVERDQPGDLAGEVDTAGTGHALPRLGPTPRLHQRGHALGEGGSASRHRPRASPTESGLVSVSGPSSLSAAARNASDEAGEVADELADGPPLARGRVVELVVGDGVGEVQQRVAGGLEVDWRHARECATTR